MLFNETTFIGIDPTAGKRPMAYAALDQDLRLLALDDGNLEKITAFVGGQQGAFIAVNSPRRPNQGCMEQAEIRENLSTVPRPGRWEGFRVAEYQLRLRNIRTPRTCRTVENCPGWMQNGFELYRRLESMGCRDFPSTESPSQILEVYPHAAYTVLLGNLPFKKTSLEGRLQRQLILHNKGLDIPDPMRVFEEITRYRILQGVLPLDGLYTAPQLDALVAAYTSWMAATNSGEIAVLGHPQEGQIVLPVAELQSKY
jgi:hypothetical protein